MVYLYYISCLRYTNLVGNSRNESSTKLPRADRRPLWESPTRICDETVLQYRKHKQGLQVGVGSSKGKDGWFSLIRPLDFVELELETSYPVMITVVEIVLSCLSCTIPNMLSACGLSSTWINYGCCYFGIIMCHWVICWMVMMLLL